MWSGEAGYSVKQTMYGDDATFPVTSWAAAVNLLEVLDVWALTVRSQLGIDGNDKLVVSGFKYSDGQAEPIDLADTVTNAVQL